MRGFFTALWAALLLMPFEPAWGQAIGQARANPIGVYRAQCDAGQKAEVAIFSPVDCGCFASYLSKGESLQGLRQLLAYFSYDRARRPPYAEIAPEIQSYLNHLLLSGDDSQALKGMVDHGHDLNRAVRASHAVTAALAACRTNGG